MFLLLCLRVLFYYKILDRCGGVVVWGEDHQGIRGSGDGMALNNSMDGLFFYFFFIFYTVLWTSDSFRYYTKDTIGLLVVVVGGGWREA